MNLLFFDIECANIQDNIAKICEFGYVLVDDKFNIIDKDNLIINPESKFDWYVIKKLLAYSKDVYMASEPYPFFYDKISSLFNAPDTLVFGHTVDGDARYLNDEAKRYNLPFFNYKFYDIRIIYKYYTHAKYGVGLEQIGDEIGSEKPNHAHTAGDDAEATMYVMKKLCEILKLTPIEIISKYPNSEGITHDGIITTIEREENAKRRKLSGADNKLYGDNYKKFYKFLFKVKPEGKVIPSELNGKVLSITPNYQRLHYKEMMRLVQLLKNHGCKYEPRQLNVDYFVTWRLQNKDGTFKKCDKTKAIKKMVDSGENIKIITFDELLDMLGTTNEELSKD